MDTSRNFVIALLLSTVIIALGTVGYMLIEGWGVLDASYMTIITLTTVGFQEVHQVSEAGRVFTIVLIFMGVGMAGYVAGSVVQFMVEGRIRTLLGRRRLDNKIRRLRNHYIICGYGRIGRVLCDILRGKPLDVVVVEKNPELISLMDEDRVIYVAGDAADEHTLIRAGINNAKGLAAVLATDIDNVYLVLTARQLHPDLFIIARAGQTEAKSKLLAAGANKVESPYDMGAVSMAQRIIRPTVTNFLDLAFAKTRKDIQMEELPVNSDSGLVNIMLKDSGIRQRFNLIIIAIKKADDSMVFNPSFEARIMPGDTVIAVGEEANLNKLARILAPPAA